MAHHYLLIIIAFFAALTSGCRSNGDTGSVMMQGKPSAPISVRVEPDDEQFNPGEIVDFRITVTSSVAIPDLHLSVDVPDALAVFSGDRQWRGPLAAGQRQELVLAIRIPEQGGQHITATAVARFEGGQAMAARDVYVLGTEPERQTAPQGRETMRGDERVREYELP